MILIIGGAYQGKTDFAIEKLNIPPEKILDGEGCAVEDVFSAVALRHFERLVERILQNKDPRDFAREICAKNPGMTIIATEIGSGIIPADKHDREWREAAGRALCVLADFSDTVVRVSCGIPIVIKGVIKDTVL